MPAYTSQQRTLMARFSSVTSATSVVAAKQLKASNWNLEQAVDARVAIQPICSIALLPYTSREYKYDKLMALLYLNSGKRSAKSDVHLPYVSHPFNPALPPSGLDAEKLPHERSESATLHKALAESYCRVEKHLLLSGPDWMGDEYVGDDEGVQMRQQIDKWDREEPFRPVPPIGDSYHITLFKRHASAARRKDLTALFHGWLHDAYQPGHWIRPQKLPAMMRFALRRVCMPRQRLMELLDNYDYHLRIIFDSVYYRSSTLPAWKEWEIQGQNLDFRENYIAASIRHEHCSFRRTEGDRIGSLIRKGMAFPGTLNEDTGQSSSKSQAVKAMEGRPRPDHEVVALTDIKSDGKATEAVVSSDHASKFAGLLLPLIDMYRNSHIDLREAVSAIHDTMAREGVNMHTHDLEDLLDDFNNEPKEIVDCLLRDTKRFTPPSEEAADAGPSSSTVSPDQPMPMSSCQESTLVRSTQEQISPKAKFVSIFNDFTHGHIDLCDALPRFRLAANDSQMPDAQLLRLFELFEIPANMFLNIERDGGSTYLANSPGKTYDLLNKRLGGPTPSVSRCPSPVADGDDLSMSPSRACLPLTPKLAHRKLADSPPFSPEVARSIKDGVKTSAGEGSSHKANSTTNKAMIGALPDSSTGSSAKRDSPGASPPFLELVLCPSPHGASDQRACAAANYLERDPLRVRSYDRSAFVPHFSPPGGEIPFNYKKWMSEREKTPSTSSGSSSTGQTDDLWGISMPTRKARALGRKLCFRKTYVKTYFNSWTKESLQREKVRNAKGLALLPFPKKTVASEEPTVRSRKLVKYRPTSELFAHRDEDHTAFLKRTLHPLTVEDFEEPGLPNVVSYLSSPDTYKPPTRPSPPAPASLTFKRKRSVSATISRKTNKGAARKLYVTRWKRSPAWSSGDHLDKKLITEHLSKGRDTSPVQAKPEEKLPGERARYSSPGLREGKILDDGEQMVVERLSRSLVPEAERNPVSPDADDKDGEVEGDTTDIPDLASLLSKTAIQSPPTTRPIGSKSVAAGKQVTSSGTSFRREGTRENITTVGASSSVDFLAQTASEKSDISLSGGSVKPGQLLNKRSTLGLFGEEGVGAETVIKKLPIHHTQPSRCKPPQGPPNSVGECLDGTTPEALPIMPSAMEPLDALALSNERLPLPAPSCNISRFASDQEEDATPVKAATEIWAKNSPPMYESIEGVDPEELRNRKGKTAFPNLAALIRSGSPSPQPSDVQKRDALSEDLPPVYESIEGVDPKELQKRKGKTVFPNLAGLIRSGSPSPQPPDVQMRDVSSGSSSIDLGGFSSGRSRPHTAQRPTEAKSVLARFEATTTLLLCRPDRKPVMFTDDVYDPDSPLTKLRTQAWNRRGNPPDLDAVARNKQKPVPKIVRELRKKREKRAKGVRELADSCRAPLSYLHQTQTSSGTGGGRASSTAGLSKLFDKYRDESLPDSQDTLAITPTIAYLTALTLALDEPAVLALLTILHAPAMGELTRDGFIAGWRSLSPPSQVADTIPKQIPIAQGLRQSLRIDVELWDRTYKHTFILARQPGQKAIQLEIAVEYWRLIFGEASWRWRSEGEKEETPWLQWYIEHLEHNWKKSINKDLWDQTAKFARKSAEDPDMSWWSEEGAWPGVLDEFVLFVRGKRTET